MNQAGVRPRQLSDAEAGTGNRRREREIRAALPSGPKRGIPLHKWQDYHGVGQLRLHYGLYLAWPGLAWPGLAWPGLAWPGLAWEAAGNGRRGTAGGNGKPGRNGRAYGNQEQVDKLAT